MNGSNPIPVERGEYQSQYAQELSGQQVEISPPSAGLASPSVNPYPAFGAGNNNVVVLSEDQQDYYLQNEERSHLGSPTTSTPYASSAIPNSSSATAIAPLNHPVGQNQVQTRGRPGPHVAGSPYARLIRDDSVDGTLSPVSTKSNGTDPDINSGRKKKFPADITYFIAKEILMTERTYKKDLEVLNLWFRDEVGKLEDCTAATEDLLTTLFAHVDPIYEVHCRMLKEIEQKLAAWEGRSASSQGEDCKKIGDVLLCFFDVLTMDHYIRYLDAHFSILERLEESIASDVKFSQVCRDFESQKVCYLPLTTLILKPLHRILYYELLLERLLRNYSPNHVDYQSTNMAMIKMQTIVRKLSNKLRDSENFVKLAEVQRDVGSSFEELVSVDRDFVREGCLQKLSRKGYQQRMFFLFSDLLLYANRTSNPLSPFRVHGQLNVKDLSVLDSDSRMGADFCFNIYDGKKAILVSAANEEEKVKWMEDLTETAQVAKTQNGYESSRGKFMSLKSISGSCEDVLNNPVEPSNDSSFTLDRTTLTQRTNSSVHVCWHRSTTLSWKEYHISLQTLLSGYLLRKFKNSNGWQKLWVVFTNSCLYFFKTFQDDFPLASLPLLGYSVFKPNPELDGIHKDFVFKLQFKNHTYFFRAESEYTFTRWIEVLSSATKLSEDLLVSLNSRSTNGEFQPNHSENFPLFTTNTDF